MKKLAEESTKGTGNIVAGGTTCMIVKTVTAPIELVINHAVDALLRDWLRWDRQIDGYWKYMIGNVVSGGTAASSSLLFLYPLEYHRVRLANDVSSNFKGVFDLFGRTSKSDSIHGFYRGVGVSCSGIFLYRFIYFNVLDFLKPVILSGNAKEGDAYRRFLLAWGATVAGTHVAYPFDMVRHRMMMTSLEDTKYTSAVNAFHSIWEKEGFKSFYRGFGVNVLHLVAGAGVLLQLEYAQMKLFGKKYGEEDAQRREARRTG
ncbi:hypothetical protein GIB67_013308 [Kingdonia uniflora]|uniref:ADP/ATP translocase n=1 Tax=Kingdonia uniflora TaxID=39325 RepID=A0A7J7LQQ0_9MAGN|nr:hypothetical protein GIB67_013308 [Kingdonia uniflora]